MGLGWVGAARFQSRAAFFLSEKESFPASIQAHECQPLPRSSRQATRRKIPW